MDHDTPQQHRKNVLQLYAVLGTSLILSVIPTMLAATGSLVFFMSVLIAAYVMRASAEDGDLIDNHTTFIIRTIWIGSSLMIITVTLGSFYMLSLVDNAPFSPCIDQFINMGVSIPSTEAMKTLFTPCIDEFIRVNLKTLIIAGIICAGPVLLYFAVRFIKGLRRALGGYRIANHKRWL